MTSLPSASTCFTGSILYPSSAGITLPHINQYMVPATSIEHPIVGITYHGMVGVNVVFLINGANSTKTRETTQKIVVGGQA
jgi:hypothetical protein